jgi:hypothetical protein
MSVAVRLPLRRMMEESTQTISLWNNKGDVSETIVAVKKQ